jgi:acylphosphatase
VPDSRAVGPADDDQPIVRRRVVVTGHVQGVWFRDSCERVAAEHGVRGWVRNLPDLRVEAALEGRPEAVAAVVAWCQEGPPRATVTGVDVREESPQGDAEVRVIW